jgi:PKD repeat protein
LSAFTSIYRVLIKPDSTSHIFVATSAGIYRSTDAGATFTQVQSGSFQSMEFMPGKPSTIYACGTTFFYSTNCGAKWTQVTTGLPASTAVGRMKLAVTAANAAYIYLLAGGPTPNYGMQGLYKSINSGLSWSTVATAIAGFDIGTPGQEWYDLTLAVSPASTTEIIAGAQNLQKSTNGGTSWTSINGTAHVDYHNAVYVSGSGATGTFYVVSDGGIYQTTNGASSWTNLNNNLVVAQMYGFGQSTTNTDTIISGHQDDGTNVHTAATYKNTMQGDGMLAFISHGSSNYMWGSQYNGTLNRSTNGGAAWSTANTGITGTGAWVTPWREDPTTANTIYAGFNNVWKSTTGGTAWTQLGTLPTGTVSLTQLAISPANSQVIWATTGTALYVTSNGGTSWTTLTSMPAGTISYIACSNTDVNKAWITYSGFTNTTKVFETTNQGTSWTNLSASLPNIPINCVTYVNNSNDATYIGTEVGVFYKDATLSAWQPFSGGLPNVSVRQIEIYYATNVLRCATYGRGLWQSGPYVPGSYAPTANFASNLNIACPGAAVQFSDLSAGQPTSWSWSFAGGNPATSTVQNPVVYYNTPGTFSVSLTATNANGTNSATQTSYITINNATAAPTTTGKNFCTGATVTLTATPQSSPGTVRWFSSAGGGSVLGTGNTFVTPALSSTTSYYVDEVFPAGSAEIVGPGTNGIGAGAEFNANDIRGLYFNITQPVTLTSFDVYSYTAGPRTIQILDSQGNTYYDTTITVTGSATPTLQAIPVKIVMYPGTGYFIKWSGTVDFYRNTAGAVYPYTSSPVAAVSITGSNAGIAGYYYFFYNWQFTLNTCNTARTICTATDTCSSTGVFNLMAGSSMNIFPNPNNGTFQLSFQTPNKDNYKLTITNTLGQIVYEETLNGFSGDYSKGMDIEKYGKGIYMLSISNSKNETVKKVIVY